VRFVYSFVLYLLTPFFLLHLLRRASKAPAYRQRWGERFAWYRGGHAAHADIWIHAVSVGEAEVAFPLVRALQARYPDKTLLLTTTTPTGSARVRAVLGDSVQHVYLPYDLPGAVCRFLRRFQPRLGIVMETEIWPNLYAQCRRSPIPLFLVNARLSEKSARGYRRLSSLVRATLADLSCIAAQTQRDADRFVALGAVADTVVVTGNIKFDQPVPDGLNAEAAAIRRSLFLQRSVWIAASTHEGEDEQLLDVYAELKSRIPALLLVLVPRHPERFDPVAALCRDRGLSVVLRSERKACDDATDLFLVNTMGELRLFYAAADAAFVGGSLVSTGGHNVLEPAGLGVPVLFGPYMFNFDAIARNLVDAGAAIQVADKTALTAELLDIMQNEVRRRRMGENGRSFVAENRGALYKTMDLIEPVVGRSPEAD
jgi:3-deoxy-D-manno-octulosonic-acid transferase